MKSTSDARRSRDPAKPAEAAANSLSSAQRSRFVDALLCLAVALAAFAAHAPSIGHGWVNWDDTAYIHNNPLIVPQPPGTPGATTQPAVSPWLNLLRMYTTLELPQYYPFTFHTFWNEYQLWGLWAPGFHAVNVILHAINAALVVLLLRRFGLSRGSAVAAGLLFALAATQVMSVAWVSERKNVLSTCWALLTMLAWGRFWKRGTVSSYLAILAFFTVTLLAKTAWLGLPLVLVVQAVAIHRAPLRRAIAAAAGLAPLSVVGGYVTHLVERSFTSPDTPALTDRLLAIPAALLHYVVRCVAPFPLTPFYPTWHATLASAWFWGPLAACIIAAAAYVIWHRRLAPVQHWGAALFLVALAPVLGVIPFGNMSVSWVSDHFAYYAIIGFFAFAVTAVEPLTRRSAAARAVAASLCGVVLLGHVVQTQRMIPIWRDAFSLWEHVIREHPEMSLGYFGRGEAWLAKRDLAKAAADYERGLALSPAIGDYRFKLAGVLRMLERHTDAERELRELLRREPDFAAARDQLADVIFHRGVEAAGRKQLPEAAQAYEDAIALRPKYAPYWNNLGCAWLDMGKPDVALQKISRAVELDPQDAPAWNNLAIAYDQSGQRDRAIEALQRAVAARPNYAAAQDRLASLLIAVGRPTEAAAVLRNAILAAPAGEKPGLRHGLARLLASTADATLRSPVEARDLANALIQETQGQYPTVFDTLGMALAAAGQFDAAIQATETALAKFRAIGDEQSAVAMEQRIAKYRTGKRIDE